MRMHLVLLALLGLTLLLGISACSPGPTPIATSATPGAAAPSVAAPAATPSPVTSPSDATSPLPSPISTTGFAFSAESVVGFYTSAGFTCGEPLPSTGAEGWTVQTCARTDADGRGLGVGVVMDPQGVLGDGFSSVTARHGEAILAPAAALEHLSGFLGAMLGDERATAQLPWLAGRMGNAYEETTDGDLRVATYLEPRDDPRMIWLEIAGPGYLAAATPTP